MSRIVVIGGTGYAGAAIVRESAARGHEVTSFSRALPADQVGRVRYLLGDAADEEALSAALVGAETVVFALSPRGAIAPVFRDVFRTVCRLADAAGVPLYMVGGYSSLRPAAGAPRFVSDLSHAPEEYHQELTVVSAIVAEDLPSTPASLDWVFVSPAGRFGAHYGGERTGTYRVGGDVALEPETGGEISAEDFALGFVDLLESSEHHREHLNLAR